MSFIRKIKVGDKIYLAEAESKRINGKVVQRHIRYVGKEVDGEKVLASSLSNPIGLYIVICQQLVYHAQFSPGVDCLRLIE